MHDAVNMRFKITSTSVVFPTGDGGSDASLANSVFATAKGKAVLAGFIITANAAGGTITFYKADGTTVIETIVLPTAASGHVDLFNMTWAPVSVSAGSSNGGFGAKTSAAGLTVTALFHTEQG